MAGRMCRAVMAALPAAAPLPGSMAQAAGNFTANMLSVDCDRPTGTGLEAVRIQDAQCGLAGRWPHSVKRRAIAPDLTMDKPSARPNVRGQAGHRGQ